MMACPTCGRDDTDLERVLAELRVELQDSESERKRLLRSNKKLKADLAGQRRQSPRATDARRLFDHWVDRLGKRQGVVYGEKREKACLSMLEQFPVETLMRAIDGIAKFPFDAGYGRRSESQGVRRDDLTFVFASEVRVEQFAQLAEDDEQRAVPAELPPAGLVKPVVAELRERFGVESVFEWWDGWWWGPCPLHPVRGGQPLRVRESPPGLLQVQCAGGCGVEAVLGELAVADPQGRLVA